MLCRKMVLFLALAVIFDGNCRRSVAEDLPKAAEPSRRAIYFAKNSSVRSLLYLLEKHFEGQAGVKFVAEPNANLLSIRADSDAVLEEVLQTMALIDKPQRQIAIQVLLVEFQPRKVDDAAAPAEVDTEELTGTAEAVSAKLTVWGQEGHVSAVKKYRLTALENQSAELLLGEVKPVVHGVSIGRAGDAMPQLIQQEFGTSVVLKPRITEANDILLELSVEESRLDAPENGIELAKGANGPLVSRGKLIATMKNTLTVPNGLSTVVSGWQLESKAARIPGVVVVSARIVDPNQPRKVSSKDSSVDVAEMDVPAAPQPDSNPRSKPAADQPANPPEASVEGRNVFRGGDRLPELSAPLMDRQLVDDLKLTDVQRQEFLNLRREFNVARRDVMAGNPPEPVTILQTLVEQFEQKRVDLLNPDQQKVWNDWQIQLKERQQDGLPAPVPNAAANGPVEGRNAFRGRSRFPDVSSPMHRELVDNLKLTEVQRQELMQLRREFDAARRNVRPGVGGVGNVQDMQTIIQILQEQFEQKSVDLLNPDQRSVLSDWQVQWKERAPGRARRRETRPSVAEAASAVPALSPAERLAVLERELEARPGSSRLLRARLALHVELQQWDAAIADLREPAKRHDSLSSTCEIASILAYRRDEAAFREAARELLQKAFSEGSISSDGKRLIARTCLLMPEWLDDPERVQRLLETSLSQRTWPFSAHEERIDRHRLDLWQGQPLLAVAGFQECLTRIESSENYDRNVAHAACLYLALAFQAIGDDVQAKSAVQRVQEELGPVPQNLESVSTHVLFNHVRQNILAEAVKATSE